MFFETFSKQRRTFHIKLLPTKQVTFWCSKLSRSVVLNLFDQGSQFQVWTFVREPH